MRFGMWGRLAVLGLFLVVASSGCGGKSGLNKEEIRKSRANAFYRLGLRYYQNGDVRAAYNELVNAVDLEPKNAIYRNSLGLISFSLGQYESAEEQFKRALKLDPSLTDAHMKLGVVYSETGRFELAEQEYFQALQDPGFMTPEKVYVNWGVMLLKNGDPEGAETKFRQAIDVSPRYPRGHYELARVLEQTGDTDAALQEYLEAWEGLSEVPDLNLKLGELYLGLGDSAQARVYFEKVIAVAPGTTEAGAARDYLKKIPSR